MISPQAVIKHGEIAEDAYAVARMDFEAAIRHAYWGDEELAISFFLSAAEWQQLAAHHAACMLRARGIE